MKLIGIVGGGLFGQIIGKHLQQLHYDVAIIDNKLEGRGSDPAACLMKPGWMTKVPRLNECLELLDNLYGVQTLDFRVNNTLNQPVHWVPPNRILSGKYFQADVQSVSEKSIETSRETFTFDKVIVAAGVWTPKLCPWVNVEPRWGAAFLWPKHIESHVPPFISMWAPYRQVVAFQRGDGLWAGDGSALKNMNSEQILNMKRRCQDKLDIFDEPKVLRGARPYTKSEGPCYLQMDPGKPWVATGGAKNGTIAAAWCALRIGEELRK